MANHPRRRALATLAVAVTLAAFGAAGARAKAPGPTKKKVLVELYTSQG